MKVLWATPDIPAQRIISALSERHGEDWHPKTVRTLLNRLVKKKAVGYEKQGRGYLYRALIHEAECQQAVSQSFLDRVFGGSLQPLLAQFVNNEKLTPQEIENLKKILEGK